MRSLPDSIGRLGRKKKAMSNQAINQCEVSTGPQSWADEGANPTGTVNTCISEAFSGSDVTEKGLNTQGFGSAKAN
jgi:hypothetical protein